MFCTTSVLEKCLWFTKPSWWSYSCLAGDTFPKPKSCKTLFLTTKAFSFWFFFSSKPSKAFNSVKQALRLGRLSRSSSIDDDEKSLMGSGNAGTIYRSSGNQFPFGTDRPLTSMASKTALPYISKIASNQCICSKDWLELWIVGRDCKKNKRPQQWGVTSLLHHIEQFH